MPARVLQIRHDFTEVPSELFHGKTPEEALQKAMSHFARHARKEATDLFVESAGLP